MTTDTTTTISLGVKTITYDILFSDGRISYGVASNIAAAARRAMRIAQREGVRVVWVKDRYAPRPADAADPAAP